MKFTNNISKSVRFRTLGLAYFGCAFLILGAIGWRIIKGGDPPEYYIYLLLSGFTMFMILSSFFVIRYKEVPRVGGLPSVTGPWAVITGVLNLIVSILGFIVCLYEAIAKILLL